MHAAEMALDTYYIPTKFHEDRCKLSKVVIRDMPTDTDTHTQSKNLYNCNCNCICIVSIVCSVSFIFCAVLCAVFECGVLFCVLCLIIVPLPPGKNPISS
jgi:hypothetical protein